MSNKLDGLDINTKKFSQEQLTKIGNAYGLLETKVYNLKAQIDRGNELIEQGEKIHPSPELEAALDFMLNGSIEKALKAAIKTVEDAQLELQDIEDWKAKYSGNNKALLAVAEFMNIVYQPSEDK